MINKTYNSATYNQFLQFKPKETAQKPAQENKENTPIATVSLNQHDQHSNKLLTKTVATLAIAGGLVGIFFAKGFSQKLFKKMTSYMRKLDDKIYDYTQRYSSLNMIQRWTLKVNKGIQKALNCIKMGNNITAAKDSSFSWLCKKLHIKKPINWVTEQFKKITVLSSKKSYQAARNIADENIAKLRDLIPKIKDEKTAQKLTEYINQLDKEIVNITNATNRNSRLLKIKETTAPIGEKVFSELTEIIKNPTKENLKKLALYRTEVHAAEGKDLIFNQLLKNKRAFSFNIKDKTDIMNNARDEIAYILNAGDNNSRNILRKISKQITKYKKLSGANEQKLRTKLVENIQDNITQLKQAISQGKYNIEDQKLLNNKIKEISEILLKTEEKGTIEDILILIKSQLKKTDPKTYIKTKALTEEMRRAINKSFETEMKLYDKFAEYSVGSAPSDVLGILLPTGLAAYAVSKGKDKEEKISATLNAGIPIIGGVMTTFYATAKMMSNMQGLVLGAVTGVLLNALGSKVDEKRKEYIEKKMYIKNALSAYQANNSKKPLNIS